MCVCASAWGRVHVRLVWVDTAEGDPQEGGTQRGDQQRGRKRRERRRRQCHSERRRTETKSVNGNVIVEFGRWRRTLSSDD